MLSLAGIARDLSAAAEDARVPAAGGILGTAVPVAGSRLRTYLPHALLSPRARTTHRDARGAARRLAPYITLYMSRNRSYRSTAVTANITSHLPVHFNSALGLIIVLCALPPALPRPLRLQEAGALQ